MIFRIGIDEELTNEQLLSFIETHRSYAASELQPLINAYMNKYKIFDAEKKPEWKPDNRIAVNFAKYIVDTMNGFFIGKPIKLTSDDEKIASYLEFLDQYNDQDDNNAELSKLCDIYGRGYEIYFVDELGNVVITFESPMNAFMIYDDSIIEKPRYFVRTYTDSEGIVRGTLYTENAIKDFSLESGKVEFVEEKPHGFDGVPATEFIENEERIGLFYPVMTMIDAYNKAISEKANDVDYFADAYMKILGTKLSEKELENLRSNRIINFSGDGIEKLIVEFLQKPNGDTTQENLINRLEKLIFQISMVANINDENFGTSSGIALQYKLQSMMNLAKTKERKFTSGMNRRYKLIFSNPVSKMKKDDWIKIKYHFSLNYPADIASEADVASKLSGIASRETQLGVLSIVDNVQDEIKRMDSDLDPLNTMTDYPTNRTIEE